MNCIPLAVVITAAVLVALVLPASAQPSPDSPLCVVTAPNGITVNLSSIPAATYAGQLASSTAGLVPVTVSMSWCKAYAAPMCKSNTTGLSLVIANAAGGSCVAAFTAVSGPATPNSNTSFSFVEWAASSGALATVTVNCDPTVPAGTAKLVGPITNSPFFMFTLTFNSSVACTSAPPPPSRFLRGLRP
jgi:hypothetical protein